MQMPPPPRPGPPGGPLARPHRPDAHIERLLEAGEAALARLFDAPTDPQALQVVKGLADHLVEAFEGRLDALQDCFAWRPRRHFATTHSLSVAAGVTGMGLSLGLSPIFVQQVAFGALIHDLGQAMLPADLLVQGAPLSPAEQALMIEHPQVAVALPGALTEVTRDAILGHHERMDGLGYPFGLKGEAVPLAARLTALANLFDGLTSERPGQPALGLEAALAELSGPLASAVDQELLGALAEALGRPPPA